MFRSSFFGNSCGLRVAQIANATHRSRMMGQDRCLYFDYNATTPLRPQVKELMARLLDLHGNPSSLHAFGRRPKEILEKSRVQVANAIGARPDEIYFCSCGTEADQWALWTSVVSWKKANNETPHVVASSIEHPAILANLKMLADIGMCTYTLIPVNKDGFVNMTALDASIADNTCLVTIMHSNNEVGTIQDFEMIRKIVHGHNKNRTNHNRTLKLHSDLAQSIGRHPVDVSDLGVDFATVVGHKMGAPKGIAALYVASTRQETLVPLIHGGGQERGMRSGTENVVLCAALGEAIQLATENLDEETRNMRTRRDAFLSKLLDAIPSKLVYEVNGPSDAARRLPNLLSISFPGIDAGTVIVQVGDHIAVSAGSACHRSSQGGVLQAMGKCESASRGTFRVSVGFDTTDEEVAEAAWILGRAITKYA